MMARGFDRNHLIPDIILASQICQKLLIFLKNQTFEGRFFEILTPKTKAVGYTWSEMGQKNTISEDFFFLFYFCGF